MMDNPTREPVEYAILPECGVVIVRVNGRATFKTSPNLRHVFEKTRDQDPPPRYVFDLDNCTTMDSTFMGTLASIGIHQRRHHGLNPIVTNIQPHVRQLLAGLGLKYILDMRSDEDGGPPEPSADQFQGAEAPEQSMLDRILMMIEAHEKLVDVDSENEVKFEGVLQSLRESLKREQGKP